MKRRDFIKTGLGTAIALSACRTRSAAATAEKPNILLLMADQFRADCMGCDGNTVIKTPNLDRIAADGVRFSSAYSSTPTCTPARAALLSGLSPWRHGMLGYGRVAERYPVEMPRAMRDGGYDTVGIGKMHFHPQQNQHGFHTMLLDESGRAEAPGFKSDYRQWFASVAPDLNPDATGIGWNDYTAKPYVLPEHLHPTRWTGDTAVRFITDHNTPSPFFMKVSFARPHSPYDPPDRFWRMYEDAPLPEATVGDWAAKFAPRNGPKDDIWHGDMGEALVRRARQGYYGSISFVDEEIGRILDALEKKGVLDNTLVVFTADHGDMTGDHNLWRKSDAYEPSARIPMLMRWPEGIVPGPRGQVCTNPVELRDVLPTFLDAAALPGADQLDGRSMLQLARGKTNDWRPWIDLEHDICYDESNHWNALTDGKWKYIYHAQEGREQLFDLANDARECHDLAGNPAHADELARWRKRLVSHLSERGEEFVKDGSLMPRPKSHLYSPHYPGCSCHPKESRK